VSNVQLTECNPRELIRNSAYHKWEAAGRPEGDGVDFWLEAEKEYLSANGHTGLGVKEVEELQEVRTPATAAA
jgi:hypothetical protein